MDAQREQMMVQPIIVLQEENSTHEDTVKAAAMSSIAAFSEDSLRWVEWREGLYAKTVRRVKPRDFNRILDKIQQTDWQWSHQQLPTGEAISFQPFSYA